MSTVDGSDATPGPAVSGLRERAGGSVCAGLCSRASVLRAAVAVAVGGTGAAALASCASRDAPTAVAASPTGGGETASVSASEVPVGGVISTTVGKDPVVLAQPTAGSYVAFSAVCTHAGGIVAPGSALVVTCPLHGSQFDLGDDGAVVTAPADRPLAEYPLAVDGDQLVLG